MPHNVSRSYYYLFQDRYSIVRCRVYVLNLLFVFTCGNPVTFDFCVLKICQSFVHFVVLTAFVTQYGFTPFLREHGAGRDPPRSGLGPWQGKYGSIYTRGERLRSGHVRSRGRPGGAPRTSHTLSCPLRLSAECSPVAVHCRCTAHTYTCGCAAHALETQPTARRAGADTTEARPRRCNEGTSSVHVPAPPLPPPHTDTHTLHAPPQMSQPIRTRHT